MRELHPLIRLKHDWVANRRDPKARFILTGFRFAQWAIGDSRLRRVLASPLEIAYRLATECVLGVELRPRTHVGAGVRIYHGVGLVVNDKAVIGDRVTLRNGVTIGHKLPGHGCPVIEDDVEIGANAVLIGRITIGRNSVIGAGSVVTRSFPENSVIAGNPARVLGVRESSPGTGRRC
jgi:putative colanic acid biosynthesis acetyltransferase WcaB